MSELKGFRPSGIIYDESYRVGSAADEARPLDTSYHWYKCPHCGREAKYGDWYMWDFGTCFFCNGRLEKQFTVLVDVDNVLEDLDTPWVEAVNKKYGTNVKVEDVTNWHIEQFFPGLSRNQVFSPLHTAEFWASLKPIEGSQEYLEKIINDGDNVVLVTAAHPDTIKYKMKFLDKYFPFISFKDVIFTSQKQLIKGDVLIDDAPHNFENAEYKGLLMDAYHNRSFEPDGEKIKRVFSWEGIYSEIVRMRGTS